ncbi:response regulator [Trinickia fusca]|uniref:Response regulator n=1 Tax=Trinickia fusca TaxID=2419777 RepID=A0A494X6E3_9BURK|nr:response regulator transcription factor [Trinickia fusca]RKP45980.1 response regulator [Trinickia fusca]
MDPTTCPPLRVFVVEDSLLVRERLAARIEPPSGNACIVGEAEDVETALSGIEESDPEAIVLDLRLTDSHGIHLLEALKNRTDPIVTIVLTNYSTPHFRNASFSAGADYFFDKTTEFDLAMDTIAQLAHEKKITREGPA